MDYSVSQEAGIPAGIEVIEDFDGLRIEVPNKVQAFQTVVGALGVLIGLGSSLSGWAEPDSSPLAAAAIYVFCGTTALLAFVPTLYGMIGKRVLIVDRDSLTVRPELFGIGWNGTFALHRVSNLRFTRDYLRDLGKRLSMWSRQSVTSKHKQALLIDYDGKPTLLLRPVEEPAANAAIAAITERCPDLAAKESHNEEAQ